MQPVMDPAVPDFVNKLQRIDTYDEIEEIMKSQDFVMAGADERFIFLEDTLIPQATAWLQDAVKVKPVTGPLRIPRFCNSFWSSAPTSGEYTARQDSAEHFPGTKSLRCTAIWPGCSLSPSALRRRTTARA